MTPELTLAWKLFMGWESWYISLPQFPILINDNNTDSLIDDRKNEHHKCANDSFGALSCCKNVLCSGQLRRTLLCFERWVV